MKLRGKKMNIDNKEEIIKEAKPATPEMTGVAWASDAIREALTKGTPIECKFYLDSLRVMAMQLLALECFNDGMGLTKRPPNMEPKWLHKRYGVAHSNVSKSIDNRVKLLVDMYNKGQLAKIDSTLVEPQSTEPQEAHG